MVYRNALVTGASSGIGRGLAVALAARGTHVIAAARRKTELASLVDEIERQGGSAEPLVLDVADGDATYEAVRAADGRRPLDLVIANAGVGEYMTARKLKWPKMKQQIEVNFLGAAATVCGALPGMLERGVGHLCGIASLAALRGIPGFATYCASKAAMRTLLDGLRMDLHGTHIYVTTILPGFVRTAMVAGNKKPMPFIVECDAAVKIILRAIDDKENERAFPWPMALAMKAASTFVPDSLFAAVNRRSKIGS
jgi:short-subunit dehydrogenase